MEQTKNVDCVWGCYCAQGYLRNNYNGRCIPEGECRSNKVIDIAPQIPGIFYSTKHLGIFRPQQQYGGCVGSSCGCSGPSCGGHHECSGPSCRNGQPIHIHNHNEAYTGGYGKFISFLIRDEN